MHKEGFKGFYSGYLPNLMSSSVLNTAELVSYFHTKQMLRKYFRDCIPLHMACGFIAGCVCVMIGTPFVMIKTRLMNKHYHYEGIMDCIRKTYTKEGASAFYKGWSAFFTGITIWNVVMFVTYEEVKKQINKLIN